jgi:DNA-nicking Smr family endonuclease
MTRPRRPRALRPEERQLWAAVARGVTPMAGRSLPVEEPKGPKISPAEPVAEPSFDHMLALERDPSSFRSTAEPPPPLVSLDRKTLAALRRGRMVVDAVVDLHGMRQSEAHSALVTFMHRSQGLGHSVVLVITGKGGGGSGGLFEERGVLRRVVPHWLRLADLRPLVLGFEESSPHHGGSGALYVRLRRRRGARTGI